MGPKRKPPPNNVRNVVSLGINRRGTFINKNGEIVQYESLQELIVILLFERDPDVVNYVSQPENIVYYTADGHKHHYTYDFKVFRADGSIEMHEVTLEKRREESESVRNREEAARKICAERGWKYIVHTDKTLPKGFECQNLLAFSAFRVKIHMDEIRASFWREKLKGRGKVCLVEILKEMSPEMNGYMNTLYHLIWNGEVETDNQKPFFWWGGGVHYKAQVWISEGRK